MMFKFNFLFTVFLLFIISFLYSQELEIIWQKCYGGSEDEGGMDIISLEGGYFIVGGTYSNDGDISFSHGSSEAWVLRIDSIGNILWEKTYGGSNGEFWRRIFPAAGNCYYLLGASGSWDGDISYDPYPGSNDLWIAKIDSIGNLIWEKIIGGGMIDMVESGAVTDDGGVVVFGWTGSQNGDVSVNYGMYDMWLVKLNCDGEIEWNKSYGTDDFDYGYSVIQTYDGGFLIGGTSTIGNNGNLTCIPHSIDAEVIILKLDSLGNIEWQNCYGGSEHDGAFGLLEIGDGYMISGYADSNDGDVTGHHGDSDVWIIKIDFFGSIIWEHCYGGFRGDVGYCIFEETNGNFTILGSTRSNDGDVSGNHSISEYDNDIWVFKVNNTGDIIWQNCFGGEGTEGEDKFNAIKKYQNEYIIATQTNFGPSYNVGCTPHGGNWTDEDYWVFEIDSLDTIGFIENQYEYISVYPNPARDYVEFKVGSFKFEVGVEIRVFGILGEKVAKLEVKGERTVWDCKDNPPGIYFWALEYKGVILNGKIILNNER